MKKKKKKSTIGSDLLDKLLLCFLGKGTRDSRLGFLCKVESSLDILQENFSFFIEESKSSWFGTSWERSDESISFLGKLSL